MAFRTQILGDQYLNELAKNFDTKRKDELINAMLPSELAEKMKKNHSEIINKHQSVSILFCAISEFASLCEHLSEMELVKLVHLVYSVFDNLVATHSVYKVEAIDNVYMCTANCPQEDPDHIIHIATMALAMQKTIAQRIFTISDTKDIKIKVKIGLHTGDVVGAVVGKKTWSYHLFGDAVNTTSRMCSTSTVSKIQMSLPFKLALDAITIESFCKKSGFPHTEIVDRGEINVKGKGLMRTFFLENRQPDAIQSKRTSINLNKTNDENIKALNLLTSSRFKNASSLDFIKCKLFSLKFYADIKGKDRDEVSSDPRSSGESDSGIMTPPPVGSPNSSSKNLGSVLDQAFKFKPVLPNLPAVQKSRSPAVVPILPSSASAAEKSRLFDSQVENLSESEDSDRASFMRSGIDSMHSGLDSMVSMRSIRSSASSVLKSLAVTASIIFTRFGHESNEQNLPERRICRSGGDNFSSGRHDSRRDHFSALSPETTARELEKSFKRHFNNINMEHTQDLSIYVAAITAIICALAGLILEIDDELLYFPLVLSPLISVTFCILALKKKKFFEREMQKVQVVFAILLLVMFDLFIIAASRGGRGFRGFEIHLIIIVGVTYTFRIRATYMYLFNTLTLVLYTLAMVAPHFMSSDHETQILDVVGSLVTTTMCTFSCSICAYTRELNVRRDYLIRKDLLLENISTRAMLRNMFPKKEHSEQLMAKKIPLEVLENVTLLYSDIKGFTNLVAKMDPYLLCTYLDALYSKFDKNIDKYGIYKLDTIGDAFVAIIGAKDDENKFKESGAVRMTKFAFDMIHDITEFCEINNLDLAMRIGIHKGTVVGSVVGKLKPRYLTWGKDTIIGTKLESSGEPNKIHISSAVREELLRGRVDWVITPNFRAMNTTFNAESSNSENQKQYNPDDKDEAEDEIKLPFYNDADKDDGSGTKTYNYSSMQNPLKTISTFFVEKKEHSE